MAFRVKPSYLGMVGASLAIAWHSCWSLLVAMGLAQPVLDFMFWAHFIKPVYIVEPFQLDRVAVLLFVSGVVGYGVGAFLAAAWNAMCDASKIS